MFFLASAFCLSLFTSCSNLVVATKGSKVNIKQTTTTNVGGCGHKGCSVGVACRQSRPVYSGRSNRGSYGVSLGVRYQRPPSRTGCQTRYQSRPPSQSRYQTRPPSRSSSGSWGRRTSGSGYQPRYQQRRTNGNPRVRWVNTVRWR